MPSFHRIAAALAVLLSITAAHAQSTDLNGIAHVAIRVHDLPATQAFYEKLGFEHAFELKNKDGVVYETFIKINDTQFLELYSPTEKDPQVGFLHLCFEGADLNALHDSYVSRGLTPNAVRKAGAGNLLFTLAGPAQPTFPQNIEYTQYQPNSLHTNDTGKHLGADRIADRMTSVSLAMVDPAAARAYYLDKLHFLPVAGSQSLLSLPGTSGQTVEIVPATLAPHARFTLQTASLKQAAKRLKQASLPATKSSHTLTVNDPDGNQIVLSDTAHKP
ncbi:VOC family protein [Granulicella tundricola]|uniref:Glyoxalase/bleomycin resistance protein/dioxygenase n=1 Tax=Granulicella tundricola (strain ATCC BAA-1859 / DSM 23138 / MP5ACTX9) TaxID=1198114 RepID=E8WZR7_GRATM|nr:VOC family protein [Granulicella tundricola]ADW67728.1 Glyoxalase/bleomycin resistance protein/dioxygenase [Granulicella tundricola MP5ACTX9]